MFILHVCDKAIHDRMNKGPEHKESKPCASLFYRFFVETSFSSE